MSSKLHMKLQNYFPSLSKEMEELEKPSDSIENEFTQARKRCMQTLEYKPFIRPQNSLPGSRKRIQSEKSLQGLEITDYNNQSESQKSIDDTQFNEQRSYQDMINPEQSWEFRVGSSNELTAGRKIQMESYNNARRRVDIAVKQTLDILKEDLSKDLEQQDFGQIIKRLCPSKPLSLSPTRKNLVTPLKARNKKIINEQESGEKKEVKMSPNYFSIFKASDIKFESIPDRVLPGFEKNERILKHNLIKSKQEAKETSLNIYYKAKEKTQPYTMKYLQRLSQNELFFSDHSMSRDESSLSPLISNKKISSPSHKMPPINCISKEKSPRLVKESYLQIPSPPLKLVKKPKIRIISKEKRDERIKKQNNSNRSGLQSRVGEIKSDREQDFDIFFGNPEAEQKKNKKLVKNIGLSLCPLYDEYKSTVKKVSEFKLEEVSLPISRFNPKDIEHVKEKFGVNLNDNSYKHLIQPQDVIKFNSRDIII